VALNGTELLKLGEEQMRQRRSTQAALVFQNPMTALNPVFSVGWQLGETLKAHGRDAADSAPILKALADVGMPDPERQAASFPHQMSGGMRQRVVIAMGMLNDPQLLIADEPTTALDVTIQAQVLQLMKRLTHEHGTALLLITHNMGVIARMCDRVAVMYAGEIVEEAPVEELFANARHPYTQGLLRSIPRVDQPRGALPTLPGAPPDMTALPSGCRFRDRCSLAQERCQVHPPLKAVAPGHMSRCWLAQDGAAVSPPDARQTEDHGKEPAHAL
jgi:oligopeptide/dipeptide ABC transporter ATP-binding protein